jgi:predicted nucleic acid-binding protein
MPETLPNTSCLIILDNIGRLSLLKDLYQTVHVSEEVRLEFGTSLPEWFQIRAVQDRKVLRLLHTQVDLGEASTIALALETEESIMILDDAKARKTARRLSLHFTGTLGVLLRAKERQLIPSVYDVMFLMNKEGFHISEAVRQQILLLAGE